jgi:hypothetical protein
MDIIQVMHFVLVICAIAALAGFGLYGAAAIVAVGYIMAE